MNKYLFGIDFGACNLKCVRVGNKKLQPIKLNKNEDGSYHTPNAIFYKKLQNGDIEAVIGQAALNMGKMEPQNFIGNLKRKLEKKNWQRFIPSLEREVNAKEIVGTIFRKIFELTTKNVPADEKAHAIITVPVIFTKQQRKFIRDAAKNAGFEIDGIVNEAFASIFGVDADEDSLNVIFDMGGSTLDVSVIKFNSGEVVELAAAGLRLGGLDIDRDILEKILRPKYSAELDARWQGVNNLDFQMVFVQNLKERLFDDDFNDSVFGIESGVENIELSRAEVEEMFENEGYGEKIMALLNELFEELSMGEDCFDKSDVTKIWATGGSLHIPYFRKILEDFFGTELFEANDYDFEDSSELAEGLEDKYLVVAGGAANYLKVHEDIKTRNAIPYRICYALDDTLNIGLPKNVPLSYKSSGKLDLSKLEQNAWKVDFYQTFSDNADFEESAYLESVQLNSDLYEKKEPPILEMHMMNDRQVHLSFQERRLLDNEKYSLEQVEEHVLNLED